MVTDLYCNVNKITKESAGLCTIYDSPRRRKPPMLTSPSSPETTPNTPKTTPNTTSSPTPSSPPTPSTPSPCGSPGDPTIFVQKHDSKIVTISGDPTAQCPCKNGEKYFFGKSNDTELKEVFSFLCEAVKACVCVTLEECYQADIYKITFTPFCEGESCAMHMTAFAASEEGFLPTEGSTGTAFGGIEHGIPLYNSPPTPADFKKITYVGCGECPTKAEALTC
uniref:DUF4789 domain-containing protein n=1 Tax=Steinernema glaseri TaxID=37863 RepID=A0A1I7Z1L9_9BILA